VVSLAERRRSVTYLRNEYDGSSSGDQSLAGGIQHDQAAWLAGRHEPKVLFTAMDRRKYGSTTGNPNNVSGLKISGLPLIVTEPCLLIRPLADIFGVI